MPISKEGLKTIFDEIENDPDGVGYEKAHTVEAALKNIELLNKPRTSPEQPPAVVMQTPSEVAKTLILRGKWKAVTEKAVEDKGEGHDAAFAVTELVKLNVFGQLDLTTYIDELVAAGVLDVDDKAAMATQPAAVPGDRKFGFDLTPEDMIRAMKYSEAYEEVGLPPGYDPHKK